MYGFGRFDNPTELKVSLVLVEYIIEENALIIDKSNPTPASDKLIKLIASAAVPAPGSIERASAIASPKPIEDTAMLTAFSAVFNASAALV